MRCIYQLNYSKGRSTISTDSAFAVISREICMFEIIGRTVVYSLALYGLYAWSKTHRVERNCWSHSREQQS